MTLNQTHTFKIRPSTEHPGESLVSLAHREGCRLIIMGTRGLGEYERVIQGLAFGGVMS